jgi:Zn-dependent peptidase ImmA (M78 family)
MFAAAEAHDDLGIDPTTRIDVFAAIDVELDLFFKPIGAAGFYMPADLFGAPGIIVNSHHPLALQRYSGAHELGHHRFGHRPDIDLEAELVARPDREQLSDEEKLAEAFASWFLAPPELVDAVLEQLGLERPRTQRDAYQLALRLGTSYKATCYHLPSLKLLDGPRGHQWAQIELRRIKEEIAPQPRPEGWHNDVWLLGDGDRDRALFVRAGDRLVVDGAWRAQELPSGATVVAAEPATPFGDSTDTVIDIARDAPRGPAQLVLSAESADYVVALEVARPYFGKYMRSAAAAEGARR